jgi:hypothetical protein
VAGKSIRARIHYRFSLCYLPQVRHLDLDIEATSLSRRNGSVSQSDDDVSIGGGSHNVARKWYEGYTRKDAKHGLRTRVFRVWELEHGRRIEGLEGEGKKEGSGLKKWLSGLL